MSQEIVDGWIGVNENKSVFLPLVAVKKKLVTISLQL